MNKYIFILTVLSSFFISCKPNYYEHPEKGSDKAIYAVIKFNRDLGHLESHDDTYFINHHGDSSIDAFTKEIIKTPHADRESDFGVLYTSRKNRWSYYVVRKSRDLYAVNYVTDENRNSLLWYKVNLKTDVIETNGF